MKYKLLKHTEEVKEVPKSKFKIGDKVVKDLYFYEKDNKGKILDFVIINSIGTMNGKIDQINNTDYQIFRKATQEEIDLYYN